MKSRELSGGLIVKRGTHETKREIFSKRSLLGGEFVREAWDFLERRGLSDRSLLEKGRGKIVEEGWHF